MVLWEDYGFILIELFSIGVVAREIQKPTGWSRADTYWATIGAVGSAYLSFSVGLVLYTGLWVVFIVMMAVRYWRWKKACDALAQSKPAATGGTGGGNDNGKQPKERDRDGTVYEAGEAIGSPPVGGPRTRSANEYPRSGVRKANGAQAPLNPGARCPFCGLVSMFTHHEENCLANPEYQAWAKTQPPCRWCGERPAHTSKTVCRRYHAILKELTSVLPKKGG